MGANLIGAGGGTIPYAGDYVSLAASSYIFAKEPSFSALVDVGLDGIGALLPFIPAMGTVNRTAKMVELADSSHDIGNIADTGIDLRLIDNTMGVEGRIKDIPIKKENIVGSSYDKVRPTQDIINPDKVEEYVNKLNSGVTIDPIEIMEVAGKGKFIIEGHHRYVASIKTGIPVDVVFSKGKTVGLPDWNDVEWKEFITDDQFWND